MNHPTTDRHARPAHKLAPQLGLTLGLSIAMLTPFAAQPAAADDDGTQPNQPRVGDPAQFYVEGDHADAIVQRVVMPNGQAFTHFYRPHKVHQFMANRDAGRNVRLVRRTPDGQGVHIDRLSDFHTDAPGNRVTTQDRRNFADALTEALASPYLNDYIDTNANDLGVGFIIEFTMPLKDNDPAPDDFPELLWFERGPNGGNSWLTLQAVTRDGEPLAPPLVVGPRETVDMTPPTRAVNSSQTFGATGVDLSRLGVSETQYLLVRSTTASEQTYEGDRQPDFKFMAVITNEEQLEIIEEDPVTPDQPVIPVQAAYD